MSDYIARAQLLDQRPYTERQAFARIIGFMIRSRRNTVGLDQRECARRMGCTQSNWGRIELGKLEVTVWQIKRIAQILECREIDLIPLY